MDVKGADIIPIVFKLPICPYIIDIPSAYLVRVVHSEQNLACVGNLEVYILKLLKPMRSHGKINKVTWKKHLTWNPVLCI